jgi:hypothetical protein
LDLVRELPSGPAACEPHQRPHTCQHPTARCTSPENSSCAKAGVHTCRKVDGSNYHVWRVERSGRGVIQGRAGSMVGREVGDGEVLFGASALHNAADASKHGVLRC